VVATAALVATPGASTTVVVRNALDGGWRAGLATALGIAFANSTHAILTGAGVGLSVREHPAALRVLSVLGASYLAWLGVGSLRRAWAVAGPGALLRPGMTAAATTAGAGFRDGLIVNLLNPAILTFYLVVVPGFLPTPAPLSRFALYAAIHVTMALACHLLWSAIFDRVRRASGQRTVVRALDLVAGIALIGLAIKTFLRF
jgi:threonine/homoserine/homoserine lactone efflux protein